MTPDHANFRLSAFDLKIAAYFAITAPMARDRFVMEIASSVWKSDTALDPVGVIAYLWALTRCLQHVQPHPALKDDLLARAAALPIGSYTEAVNEKGTYIAARDGAGNPQWVWTPPPDFDILAARMKAERHADIPE